MHHTCKRWFPSYLSIYKQSGEIKQLKPEETVVQQTSRTLLTLSNQLHADTANDPVFGKKALNKSKENFKKSEKKDGFQSKHKNTSFATNINKSSGLSNGAGSTSSSSVCPLCILSHDLDDWELFYKKTKEQRKEVLKEKKLCFACYGKTIFQRAVLEREGVKMQEATSICSPH